MALKGFRHLHLENCHGGGWTGAGPGPSMRAAGGCCSYPGKKEQLLSMAARVGTKSYLGDGLSNMRVRDEWDSNNLGSGQSVSSGACPEMRQVRVEWVLAVLRCGPCGLVRLEKG